MSEYPPGPSGLPADPEPPPLPPAAQPYVPQYLPYSSGTIFPYESARPRARVVIGLLWASVALQVLMVWPTLMGIADLRAARAGVEVSDGLTPALIAEIVIGLVYLVVYIVLVVFWMMWVHLTYRNLRPLGAEGLAYSPGWAVGYNFIPILNLFRPYQVMRETWRASDPRHAGGTHWMAIAAPALIGVWWTMYLLSHLAGAFSALGEMSSGNKELLYAFAWFGFFLLVFGVALALVEIRVVRSLTDLQDARAGSFGTAPFAGSAGAYGAAAGGHPAGFYPEAGAGRVPPGYAAPADPSAAPPPEPWRTTPGG